MLLLSLAACNTDLLNGKDGLSAYDVAVEEGYEGTLEEWLASFKGSRGPKGKGGDDGINGKDGVDGVAHPDALIAQKEPGFVIVTEYIQPNSGKDVSNAIQDIINSNPGRTIFFPDGEYLISKPIKTSAKHANSVSLLLSNYAQIKAMDSWDADTDTAMIMLGEAEHFNNVTTPGSNYFLQGGIINCNGVANGVFICSGRETRVEDVSIKNTVVGIKIFYGTNSGSADADIINVNITGNGKFNSIGAIIDAYDNTLENMRISGVRTGMQIERGGNFLRDIHLTLEDLEYMYSGSVGFYCPAGGSWFDYCTTDNYETGYRISYGGSAIITNCHATWSYLNAQHADGFQITRKIGFHFSSQFNSILQNCKADFSDEDTKNAFVSVGAGEGTGSIITPHVIGKNDDETYKDYLTIG